MKKIFALLMAVLMLTAAFPVNAFAANLDTDNYINGITLGDPDKTIFVGYKVSRASDPSGTYVASHDEKAKVYSVKHYIYLDKFDTYTIDWDFGSGGSLEIAESNFESSEYTFLGKTQKQVAIITYTDNANQYTMSRVSRASDASGVYGCTAYKTTKDGQVIDSGIAINRFVYASGTTTYIKDSTFAQVKMSEAAFAESEYTYVYDDVLIKEELNTTGKILSGSFGNFVDNGGTHYAVGTNNTVYKIDGDTVTIGTTEYYYLTKTTAVSYDDLTPVNQEEHCTHHYVGKYDPQPTCTKGGVIVYTCDKCGSTYATDAPARGHNYQSIKVVKPTCTAKGYTQHTCTRCGVSYKDTYKNALGHVAVVDKAVPATFKSTGLTQGSHCTRCGKVIKAQKKIAMLGTVKFNKLTVSKKQFKLSWYAVKNVQGYQMQYSLKSNYKNAKTVKIANANTKSKTVKGLKSGKTYYVRIRAYKKINGKMQYSAWSKAKVKVK